MANIQEFYIVPAPGGKAKADTFLDEVINGDELFPIIVDGKTVMENWLEQAYETVDDRGAIPRITEGELETYNVPQEKRQAMVVALQAIGGYLGELDWDVDFPKQSGG